MNMLLTMTPTVLLVVYSQLVMKWRVSSAPVDSAVPVGSWDKAVHYLTDPVIISAYFAALLGSVFWVFVIEGNEISDAFPVYVGLVVLFVSLGGTLLFDDAYNMPKLGGILFILLGVILVSRN